MKHILSFTFYFITSIHCFSTILNEPVVDQRVELLSIVFRLAECDEYNSDVNEQYVTRIHKHFDAFSEHELIRYTKKIRQYGIGYDAVAQMAIHIGKAPELNPLKTFNKNVPEIRWGKSRALKFLQLLRQFYTDANCSAFFQQEEDYYKEVLESFRPNYEKIDLDWYIQFYGIQPIENFKIIVAPGNGGSNYGPHLTLDDGTKEIYAIMGAWNFNEEGKCIFPTEEYFSVLLHEFNHSFVNPLLPDHENVLESSLSNLHKSVEPEMQNQAYGDWQVMFNESLVRAAVIQYMIDHNFDEKEITEERDHNYYRGFYWINELVDLFSIYSEQRVIYPTFRDFMPAIVEWFNEYNENIGKHFKKFNEKRPQITSISEFSNGDTNIDPEIKTITIHFDREMLGQGYSINFGNLGKKHFPEIKKIYYSEDKKSIVIEVSLKKNEEYQLLLTGLRFKSKEGVPIKDYEVRFKTLK